MGSRKLVLFFVVILLFVINVSFIFASPKGLPNLCPADLNLDNINSYWQVKSFEKFPSEKTNCYYDGVLLSCDDARHKFVLDHVNDDVTVLNEKISECKDDFKGYKNYYSELLDYSCGDVSYVDYFVADHPDGNGGDTDINNRNTWNSNYKPVWEYDVYTGKLNGVKQYDHRSLDDYYWKDGDCPYQDNLDAVDVVNDNGLLNFREPLYQTYCNSVKEDNKRSYESCWSSNEYRSCTNDCDSSFNVYDVPSYDTDKVMEISKQWSDCVIGCEKYKDSFKSCMYNKFVLKYCWIPIYLGVRNDIIDDVIKFYTLSDSTYGDALVLNRAVENDFFVFDNRIENVDYETVCPDGMEYDVNDDICYSVDSGSSDVSIVLDSNTFDSSISSYISGTVKHICNGDCPGISVFLKTDIDGDSDVFSIDYDGDTFLTKSNMEVKFKIYLNDYNVLLNGVEPKTVKLFQDETNFINFKFVPPKVKGVNVIPDKTDLRQGDLIHVSVLVDGPKNLSYTYILSSALDANFIYNGEEYPIVAMISSNSNKLDFEYKPPMISRVVNAKDFYLDELGELSMGLLTSSTKTIGSMLLGHALASKLAGVTVGGYAVETVVGNTLTTADGLSTFGMDGFLPASFSFMGLLGDTGGTVGMVGDIGYQSYSAYKRADERFKVFANTKEHVYPVPLKVSVKADGFEPVEKSIKLHVTAPEAIVK